MSLSLPPEILDLIIDHLHDEPTTLRACCLVSKSWIPRARIHFFNRVEFHSTGPTIESWTEAFPDPSNSPAHYTRSLHLNNFNTVTVAISDARPWVHSFNNIIDLQVVTVGLSDHRISFTQFHGLSPTLKSLHLFYSFALLSEVLDFICSFPLLEDLSLCSVRFRAIDNADKWNDPSTSPKFTGSLLLSGSNHIITRKLLDLPGGLRFSKIRVRYPIEECNLTQELVSACSDTLESLCVEVYRDVLELGMPLSLDLSKATKLKDVEFRPREPIVSWINATLQTAGSKNLRQIVIHIHATLVSSILLGSIGESTWLEWRDLDRLLVQLWITRSIHPVITYEKGAGNGPRVLAQKLLPELVSRGFDVV